MAPGLFLIAILGCGEGDAACTPVRTLSETYESRSACMAATEAALLRVGDVDYPAVVAQCVSAAQAASLRVNAGEVARPAPPSASLPAQRIALRR